MNPRPPIDFNGLDTTVYGAVRLGALSSLQIDGPLDFTTLKKRLDVADGALGIHMLKLEEAKYVHAKKTFVGRRPRTTYQITAMGRKALSGYLQSMRRLLQEVERRQPPGR